MGEAGLLCPSLNFLNATMQKGMMGMEGYNRGIIGDYLGGL